MARSRRKRVEEPVHHERWIVSYADFITLLFAFFVVMYSLSSVNEGKYRVLSNTLSQAFKEAGRTLEPIQLGELKRDQGTADAVGQKSALIETDVKLGPGTYEESGSEPVNPHRSLLAESDKAKGGLSEAQRLQYLSAAIGDMLAPYVEAELIDVDYKDGRVLVDMKNKLLFPSGSAELSRVALKVLRDISKIIGVLPNRVWVEGYTDNRPIRTNEFPSNWALSAARAASVVDLISRLGVEPRRLAAIGFGEYHPIADNASEAGRQKNRRVTLVIIGQGMESDLMFGRLGTGR